MQRISVDLPEPDGPQMTIFSPCVDGQIDVPQNVELAKPLVDIDELDGGQIARRGGRRGFSLGHATSTRTGYCGAPSLGTLPQVYFDGHR